MVRRELVKTVRSTALTNSRPNLPSVSEEMKAWSAALSTEVTDWPQVTKRAFFGFTAFYRRNRIFALLPRTRAMETPNSLAFKLERAQPRILARLQSDERVSTTEMQKARWFRFEMAGASDLRHALEWVGKAYKAAGKRERRD